MKVCKKCGNVVNDDIKFCPECGDNMSVPVTRQNQFENNYQPRQYGVPEYEAMPVYNVPEEPQKPKKSGLRKIFSVVLKIFLVLFAVMLIAILGAVLSDDDDKLSKYSYDNAVISNSFPFTTGEIADGVYINEWANLKYTIPEGYARLWDNEVDYLAEGEIHENTGFYLVNGGNVLALFFENYDISLYYADTKDYLEYLCDDEFKEDFASDGFEVEISDTKTMQSAEREFVYCHAKIFNDEGYYYRSVFVTEIEGRMSFVLAVSSSATENEAMMLGLEAIR